MEKKKSKWNWLWAVLSGYILPFIIAELIYPIAKNLFEGNLRHFGMILFMIINIIVTSGIACYFIDKTGCKGKGWKQTICIILVILQCLFVSDIWYYGM